MEMNSCHIPEIGAVCISGHVRICAGASGNRRPYRDMTSYLKLHTHNFSQI